METIPEFRNTFETFRNWAILLFFLVISNIIGRGEGGGRGRFHFLKKLLKNI